ncbi:MAG TPA: hypothetical protein VN368_03055 [Candidatus Methylomirabilis sp.]|nr:hypothetical protein [Candidatus Methylomirabilis sp.]
MGRGVPGDRAAACSRRGEAMMKIDQSFEYFEAVNGKNGHRYRLQIRGQDIVCSCPDAKSHHCKHEIAVARDMNFFKEVV